MRFRRYESRSITFCGVREHDGWRIKTYAITCADPVDLATFDDGLSRVLARMPAIDPNEGRAGVGFAIAHAGRGMDYIVLGWWNRENELPLEIVVREQQPSATWRDAAHGESVCVWDLQVISAERHAYVATLLNGEIEPGIDAYLAITASS